MATYYVSSLNAVAGIGTKDNPFRTISQAARIARSGDTIVISGGTYREWVNPLYGGISDRERIVYRAAEGERVIISGAEVVEHWEKDERGWWTASVDNAVFGSLNPFAERIAGDWFDNFGRTHHTGQVYLDGIALYEASDVSELLNADKHYWFATVNEETTTISANFGAVNPNEHLIEVNARPCCFFPTHTGVNYITLSHLEFCQAASQWAPPTAFQPAAVGAHWSKGWVIEYCEIHDAKCSGLSIGKTYDATDNDWVRNAKKGGAQTYTEIIMDAVRHGWNMNNIGSHFIHHNHIYNCGQAGIVGNMGGIHSRIVANHIHDINNRGEFGGAEMAGIKLHAAIDVHIEGNCFHHCIRGLWLDWEAQGARVTRNAFFENIDQDFFIEVCHGPCVIDNNLFLSRNSLLNVSQGSAFVNNLFMGHSSICRETARFTLYHFPHDTFVAGSMVIYGGDDRVIGNLFLGECSGTDGYHGYPGMQECKLGAEHDSPYACIESTLPVEIRNNAYGNGAKACETEQDACFLKEPISVAVQKYGDHWFMTLNADALSDNEFKAVTTEQLGKAFQTNQWYDNPDGTDLCIDCDFLGRHAGVRIAGPFQTMPIKIQLDPE